MINKDIVNSIGTVKDLGYGTAGVESSTPPKAASIMKNKNTASTRCGYGTHGVDVPNYGSGPKRSSRRGAGVAPPGT